MHFIFNTHNKSESKTVGNWGVGEMLKKHPKTTVGVAAIAAVAFYIAIRNGWILSSWMNNSSNDNKENNLESGIMVSGNWQFDEIKEDKIWQKPDYSSPENIPQQFIVQVNILKKLVVINFLSYYFGNFINNLDQQKDYKTIIKLFQQGDDKSRERINAILKRYSAFTSYLVRRFIKDHFKFSILLSRPEFLQLHILNPLHMKENHHKFSIPFLRSGNFDCEPSLNGKEYLLAIIDYENPRLKSLLLETYIKNLSLTLQNVLKENSPNITGASLVLKGRIPYSIIQWFRGSSPLEPTPIPGVEIVYAIPIPNTYDDFLFTLKKGTSTRIKKTNKFLPTNEGKAIYSQWQIIRSFTVIDDLINHANKESLDYNTFTTNFWKEFQRILVPVKDIPDWKIFKSESKSELESNFDEYCVVSQKLLNFKDRLNKEIQETKDIGTKTKNERILVKMNSRSNLDWVKSILERIKYIAQSTEEDVEQEIFHLDWNHIIYDTIKEKDYTKNYGSISVITSQELDRFNVSQFLYRNDCILAIYQNRDALSYTYELSASETPILYRKKIETNVLFNNVLLNILFICCQLRLNQSDIEKYFNITFNEIKDVRLFRNIIRLYNTDFQSKKLDPISKDAKKSEADDYSGNDKEILDFLFQIKTIKYEEQIKHFFSALINSVNLIQQTLISESKKLKAEKEKNYISPVDTLNSIGNWFDSNNKDKEQDESDDNSAEESQGIIEAEDDKLSLSEEKVVEILQKTPLVDNISFLTIVNVLQEYKSSKIHKNITPNIFLNRLWSTLLGNQGGRKYFYFFHVLPVVLDTVKYIYIIDKQKSIKVANERLRTDVGGDRPTHSELANGCGVLAAGEMIFKKKKDESSTFGWYLDIVNNGSGHYRPTAHKSLPTAKKGILQEFRSNPDIHIPPTLSLLNSLKPGMTLASGWDEQDEEKENLSFL